MSTPLKRMYPLMEQAIKCTGTYNPVDTAPYFIDQVTAMEYKTAYAFLAWVHKSGLTFGRGNFDQVASVYMTYLMHKHCSVMTDQII